MKPDAIHYSQQWDLWRSVAVGAGYAANFRSQDILTSLRIATSVVAPGDLQFFQPTTADANDPTLNTSAPNFAKGGGQVPSSNFFGLYGAALLVEPAYAVTPADEDEIYRAVASGLLTVQLGNQPILSWQNSGNVQRRSGGGRIDLTSADASAAHGQREPCCVRPLPFAKALNPGAQISATLRHNVAAALPEETIVTLLLHMFIADQGNQ